MVRTRRMVRCAERTLAGRGVRARRLRWLVRNLSCVCVSPFQAVSRVVSQPHASTRITRGRERSNVSVPRAVAAAKHHPSSLAWGSIHGSTHLTQPAATRPPSTPTTVPHVPKVPGEGAALAWRARGDGGASAPPLGSNQCGHHLRAFWSMHTCPNAACRTAAQLQRKCCGTLSLPPHARPAGAVRLLARSASGSTRLQGSTRSPQAAALPTTTRRSRCTARESALQRAFLAAQQPSCTSCALARAQREPSCLSDRRGATLRRH